MIDLTLDVDMSGAAVLNASRASAIFAEWETELLDSFGRQGLSEIGFWMDQFFKAPTPYYETQVTFDRSGHEMVIHDRGIIYGPWLAGVGTRNATSRFKGYTHWRRTFQYLAGVEGQRILDRYATQLVSRLGGG